MEEEEIWIAYQMEEEEIWIASSEERAEEMWRPAEAACSRKGCARCCCRACRVRGTSLLLHTSARGNNYVIGTKSIEGGAGRRGSGGAGAGWGVIRDERSSLIWDYTILHIIRLQHYTQSQGD